MLINFALKGQWIKIAKPFCTALSGRLFGDRYPPRCGGLLRIAPKGAEEKTCNLNENVSVFSDV
jgi:hypothetical protein